VYGGLQDNGSLMGRSRTLTDGIQNHDWLSIGGGDGMQPRAEPGAARYVYAQSQNGAITRLDQYTAETVSIRPPNREGEPPHRFTWNAPLLVSPHSPSRLYFGSHKLMRSDDRGTTWQAVSGDLTRAINRDTMPVMGRIWPENAVGRHLFTNTYSTITAIDESVLKPGLLIVGTDDGLIQISENGGQSWRSTRLPNVPDLANIVEVLASRHDERVVYAVAQNFQRGDFKPYVFRSTDGGHTWSSIRSNLPDRQVAWSIVEDHVDRNLLFLGTEFGLFFTPDSGKQWVQLRAGVPTIMFRDLAIQRRDHDLIAGTFGRGIYVLDDYAPLRALTPAVIAQAGTLLPVRPAWQHHQRRNVPGSGQGAFSARNPLYGALLTYYAGASAGNLAIRVTNAAGEQVARIDAPGRAGVHRLAWDLRLPPRDTVVAAAGGSGAGRGAGAPGTAAPAGRGGRGRASAGPPAPPGLYTAQLGRINGAVFTPLGEPQRFEVKALPPILPPRMEGS
ncbi:MAG TPA: hypothetical protein VK864_02230, partial [Longimicrobiales bacterium]|nr:hypothetical protein [Longimicrobiales bacterium]